MSIFQALALNTNSSREKLTKVHSQKKKKKFLKVYGRLVKKHDVELKQAQTENFLDKWYCRNVRKEIDFGFERIKEIKIFVIKSISSNS